MLFDSAMDDSIKVVKLEDIQSLFHAQGYHAEEVMVLTDLARLEDEMENEDAAIAHFYRALELSRSIGFPGMSCQLFGVLASIEKKKGRDELAAALMDSLTLLARKIQNANQAARAEEFRASWARAEGRLGAAHLLYKVAREKSKKLKGGAKEIRYIVNLAGFYADLGCWDLVAGLVRQAEAMDPTGLTKMDKGVLHWMRMKEAQVHFAWGNHDSAIAVAEDLLTVVGPRPKPLDYLGILRDLARYLLRSGQLERAAEVITIGMEQARADN